MTSSVKIFIIFIQWSKNIYDKAKANATYIILFSTYIILGVLCYAWFTSLGDFTQFYPLMILEASPNALREILSNIFEFLTFLRGGQMFFYLCGDFKLLTFPKHINPS